MKYLTARATKNSDGISTDFLHINNCGFFTDTSNTIKTLRPHGRSDYQLIYIGQGSLEITENGSPTTVESGNVILFRPHEAQIYSVPIGSSFYWIHFSGTEVPRILSFFKERKYKIGQFPEFEEFCNESVQMFAEKKTNFELMCKGMLLSLIALLSQKTSTEDTEGPAAIKNALLDIHTNFTVQRSNDEYAKMCGLSKSHFIRTFHNCTGMPPQKYRIFVAINEAKHLLKSNNVNSTADILGYSDVFYFSRVFKKHTGISPKNYKKQTTNCKEILFKTKLLAF